MSYRDADGDICYSQNEIVPNTCEASNKPLPAEHMKAMTLLFVECPICGEANVPHYTDENGERRKVSAIAWRGRTVADFRAYISQMGGVER